MNYHEDVSCAVGKGASLSEQLSQIPKLAMDISTERDRRVDRLDVALLDEDLE